MYRLTRSARSVSLRGGRSVYRPVLAIVSRSKATSQGHATGKSEKTLHKDADVQSASVKAGRSAKKASEGSASEEHQPFDVARQGGSGGTSKSAEGTGSFKDQVGGQEGGAGVMGGTEKTGDQTVLGKLKDTFGGTSRSPGEKRHLHTSTSNQTGSTTPRTDPDGARKPVDKDVRGEQNPHLKHKQGGSDGSPKKGNAAPDPHLPSHQSGQSTSSSTQKRGFSTSSIMSVARPPGGLARSLPSEPGHASYERSDVDADSQPPPADGLKPASDIPHSSTSTTPPNDTLAQAAKDGTLADRNEQPHPEAGRQGIHEAWKHRK